LMIGDSMLLEISAKELRNFELQMDWGGVVTKFSLVCNCN
jgi:hypothetical protein